MGAVKERGNVVLNMLTIYIKISFWISIGAFLNYRFVIKYFDERGRKELGTLRSQLVFEFLGNKRKFDFKVIKIVWDFIFDIVRI